MDRKKIGKILLGLLICFLFLVTRLKPLAFQTVGYTYDQGRDFLKAAEMVLYHNPTFIGPTTGIMGLYHGAWWYYILAIPFLLFRGLPIGYYYFNLLIQFASFVLFFFFARKYFGWLLAFLFSGIVALSPYFVFTSVFVGNNIMVLPVLLCFLMVNFVLLEEKRQRRPLLLAISAGLLLGMIAEFELSFGIFLVPTYFLGVILFRQLRQFFFRLKNGFLFLVGLGIAFTPRLLFEVKHHFEQTRILLSFFTKPKLYNPKPYSDILSDRFSLFRSYYEGIFSHSFFTLLFLLLFITAIIFIMGKKKAELHKTALRFFLYLMGMLFFLSTLYKDNFWGNYYEGIQYLFIFILMTAFAVKIKAGGIERYVKVGVLALLLLLGVWRVFGDFGKTPKKEGLAVQTEVINYIVKNEPDKRDFCVRIYTPPVIPYTYNYLFLYSKLQGIANTPQNEWTNKHCWFIVEKDSYQARQKTWTDANFPAEFSGRQTKIFPDVEVIRYQLK